MRNAPIPTQGEGVKYICQKILSLKKEICLPANLFICLQSLFVRSQSYFMLYDLTLMVLLHVK